MKLFSPALAAILFVPAMGATAPPALTGLFPGGAQRGTTVDVRALGTFERWPVQAFVVGKGLVVRPAKDKGKLSIAVAADAVPGIHWLRLFDEQGATALRPFLVGTALEIPEREPNDDYRKPQVIAALPVVVNGRLEQRGDVDCFAMALKKGQALVASVEANRTLGSPMDAVLQIVSPSGSVMADNHDYHGLDPQIVFVAPADGTFIVRLYAFPSEPGSDISFAGAATYVYRLTLTTGGFAEHAWPLAVASGSTGPIRLIGWNVPANGVKANLGEADGATISVWNGDVANTAAVRVEPHVTVLESETKGVGNSQALSLPVTVTGRISARNEVDAYRFQGKKGQAIFLQVESRSLGFPLDPVLRVADAKGALLTESDDNGTSLDPELTFTPAADGEFRAEVRDLYGAAGPRFVYRLRATSEPDFSLSLATDHFVVSPGKPLAVAVKIDRRLNPSQPIVVHAEGLPDGVTAEPVKTNPADKTVQLMLIAKKPTTAGPFRIVGKAGSLIRTARGPATPSGATSSSFWVTAVK